MMRMKNFCYLLLIMSLSVGAVAQTFSFTDSLYGATVLQKRTDPAMLQWRKNRFGQFLHWGLYAAAGGEWNGKVINGSAEWLQSSAQIPASEYAVLLKKFNPVQYDPRQWARVAAKMGVKYVIITTKHHEGFCLWPTKYTDFSIASTPYKKDLLKPLINAYEKEGIDVYFYYSIIDWHHPDYRRTVNSAEDRQVFEKYMGFVKNQLKELITAYPTIKGFWFDGQWEESYKKSAKTGYDLEMFCRNLKPGIILNNRLRTDAFGNVDHDYKKRHFGDFDGSFERRLPANTKTLDFDWEACMTVPENQWGYNRHWTGHTKTSNEVIEMIATCASMGGNFVLNFGPQAEGTLREEELKLASQVGAWMNIYGKAIYGCDNSGLEKQDWGYYTQKPGEDKVNMVVFNVPISKQLKVTLPENTILSDNTLLTDGGKHYNVEKLYGNSYYIHLDEAEYTAPFVIILNLKRS